MSEPQVLNAPDRIWLVVGDIGDDARFPELAEVTWCDHAIGDSDVPYVRADLHAAAEARVRELTAVLDFVATLYEEANPMTVTVDERLNQAYDMRCAARAALAAVDAEKGNDDE